MSQTGNDRFVCRCCIGDRVLADEVRCSDTILECSYCGRSREAVSLDTLVQRIDQVLREHFTVAPDYSNDPLWQGLIREGAWRQEGSPLASVIADVVRVGDTLACDIVDLLIVQDKKCRASVPSEIFYSTDGCYKESEPDEWPYLEKWDEFSTEVRTRARFFSPKIPGILDDIFGDLSEITTSDGLPVVRVTGQQDADRFLWRARGAQSEEEVKTIVSRPDRELGPPPSKVSGAGRMNARGIPVFYGAKELKTCVAEVRPSVGGYVVAGKFELIRPVRLLDLSRLAQSRVKESFFDSNYSSAKDRIAFLRSLVSEIGRPVVPPSGEWEYLPTQVVAEYLANSPDPNLDGVIFTSSQIRGSGENVVLFNRACAVEPYDIPEDTDLKVYIPPRPDTKMDEILFREIRVTELRSTSDRTQFDSTEDLAKPEDGSYNLRLDRVVVLEIDGVEYDSYERIVIRDRS